MNAPLRIGVAGLGTVGTSLLRLIQRHGNDIAVRTGEKVAWDPTKQELIGGNQQVRAMLRRSMRAPWTL